MKLCFPRISFGGHITLSQRPISRGRLARLGVYLLGLIGLLVSGRIAGSNERKDFQLGRCRSHIKQLGLMVLMYSDDYQGHLPPAGSWAEAIKITDYLKDPKIYRCPLEQSPGKVSYAMNAELGGKLVSDIADPADTPLLYEIPHPGENPHGNPSQAGSTGRHGEKYTIAYADGHAAIFDPKEKYRPPGNQP